MFCCRYCLGKCLRNITYVGAYLARQLVHFIIKGIYFLQSINAKSDHERCDKGNEASQHVLAVTQPLDGTFKSPDPLVTHFRRMRAITPTLMSYFVFAFSRLCLG